MFDSGINTVYESFDFPKVKIETGILLLAIIAVIT